MSQQPEQVRAAQRRITQEVLAPMTERTITLTRNYADVRADFRRLLRQFEALFAVSAQSGRCWICRRPVRGPWQLRKHLRTFHGVGRG